MFKLWKSAVDSSLALLLDDAEANNLTPDSLLTLVEEFSVTSQAVEHSFPALLVTNGDDSLSAEYLISVTMNILISTCLSVWSHLCHWDRCLLTA
jgi:hypothetical protein